MVCAAMIFPEPLPSGQNAVRPFSSPVPTPSPLGDLLAVVEEPAFVLRSSGRVEAASTSLLEIFGNLGPIWFGCDLHQLIEVDEAEAERLTRQLFLSESGQNIAVETLLPGGAAIELSGRLLTHLPGEPLVYVRMRRLDGLVARIRALSGRLKGAAPSAAPLHAEQRLIEDEIEALERRSCLDGLTGLANRRTFDEHMRRVVRQSVRETRSCALVLVDVDDFKAINDTLGHAVGDQRLIAVADAVRDLARRPLDLSLIHI